MGKKQPMNCLHRLELNKNCAKTISLKITHKDKIQQFNM